MYIRALPFILLAFLLVSPSFAQKPARPDVAIPGLKVDNWQMDQGLPVNSIMTVAQTADGWLFFGTEEGLVRFDGTAFSVMNKSNVPEFKVNFISSLLGGRDTSLWIGTEGDGLLRFKDNKYVKYNTSNGLSDDRIFSLYEDPDGGLWAGTSGGGLNYLKNGKISGYDTSNGLANNFIRAIASDAKGRIWIGTQKGLSVIENGKISNFSTKDGLSDDFIETLAFDKEQTLWIGTKSGGLNVLKNGVFSVYTIKNGLTADAVTSLCFDANGMLWIGTNGGGITRMKDGKFYPFTTKDGLSGDLIVALFADREENIWAGTSGFGIDRIKKKLIQTISLKDGLPGTVILPVFVDHAGVLWAGVAGKGLVRMENGKARTYNHKDGLPEDLVLAIGEDLNQTLWIGTAGGGLANFSNGKFIPYTTADGLSNNVVVSVYCDRSGAIWAGTTGGGINRFINGKFSSFTAREGLSNDNVNCILEDRKGNLWVGTNGGLNRISRNKITVINEKDGLSDNYILSLYEDADENLWVGTAANGFNLIRNGKISQFTTNDGLINEVVLKILEDQYGYFWISCNKGIYKIKRQDLLDFADQKILSLNPVSYGKTDGMESIECNGGVTPAGCIARDGKLMFPTMDGISVIDPKLMQTVSSGFSPVFIEEFLVDGRLVDMNTTLPFPSYSNRLEFRYAALNYANPGKIRYRYMLLGFDKGWIDCGTKRSATYTNIPGGNYVFKVMATNESGQWNDGFYAVYKFHLKPPFYRSFLFYLVVAIFLGLLILFAAYYFLGRIQRNRLKHLVDERTHELNQQIVVQKQTQEALRQINEELKKAKEQAESGDRLKTAFLNNISHEIRTPLNGILGFSQLMADPDLTQEERDHYVDIVKSSSTRLTNTVTDYMDISLIVSGNMEVHKTQFDPDDLLKETYQNYLQPCRDKNLSLSVHLPSMANKTHINSDQGLLDKVLHHLVDNSVKFTKTGSVSFGYAVKETELEFFVKDTGTGIKKEVQPTIFDKFIQENTYDTRGHEGSGLGLSIVKGIVELLGGRVWLESEKNAGSSFYFTVPVN